jgi:hypothetical protein
MTDMIIQQIEQFRCPRGNLFAERRNRGYTLFDADPGAPVARLSPTGHEGRFEVLYWSLWKERWASAGPSDAPSCQSMTPYSLSLMTTSSGS